MVIEGHGHVLNGKINEEQISTILLYIELGVTNYHITVNTPFPIEGLLEAPRPALHFWIRLYKLIQVWY